MNLEKRNEDVWKYYNCIQASMNIVCKKFQRNPVYMFAPCFGMRYLKQKDLSNEFGIIEPNCTIAYDAFYRNIYDININEVKNVRSYSLSNINILKEKHCFCIVCMDTFYCEWNSFYQKKHAEHIAILSSVDIDNKILFFIDPYAGDDVYTESEKAFWLSLKNMYVIDESPYLQCIQPEDIFKILIYEKNEEMINHNYTSVVQNFENIKKYNQLFKDNNPYIDENIINIKQLVNNHRGVASMIAEMRSSYMKFDGKLLDDALSIVTKLADNWSNIHRTFISICILQKIPPKKMEGMIAKFIEQEELEKTFLNKIGQITDAS